MTSRDIIHSDHAPAAIGPYSQAVRAGDWILCSGQVALDAKSGEFKGGDVASQTRKCLENLAHVLEAAGSGLDRALRMTVYLKDMNDFATVNEVYGTFFPSEPPARACVEVARLPKDAAVEIDCIALAR